MGFLLFCIYGMHMGLRLAALRATGAPLLYSRQLEAIVYLLNSQPRIMQFYLFDWFSVFRLLAIIPTFDLTWKSTPQMWLSTTFLWEANFCRQKIGI